MTTEKANTFAAHWIAAWNAHDLGTIISHYAETIRFSSPLIQQIAGKSDGTIDNRSELKAYFAQGLAAYPDLHFKLIHVLTGVNSVVLYYESVKNMLATEVFFLDEAGLVTQCFCHYTDKGVS
jgi:hypothetical protein